MKPIIEKMVGPELMVYDTEKDSVHILNPTARRIYELRRQGMQDAEIARALQAEFRSVPEASLLEEVRACLQDFEARHLV